jgi:hypothetical protein
VAKLAIWLAIAPILVKTVASRSASTVARLAISSVIVQVLHQATEALLLASVAVKKVTSPAIAPMATPVVVVSHLEAVVDSSATNASYWRLKSKTKLIIVGGQPGHIARNCQVRSPGYHGGYGGQGGSGPQCFSCVS